MSTNQIAFNCVEPGLGQLKAAMISMIAVLYCSLFAIAQQPPSIGYMFPPGGQAGQTVEVSLGGYDWTPDMQVFVHDSRIDLEIIGHPGPILIPDPPYWFGKKARRAPFGLPRETKAKLTIPVGVDPGIFKWQAANANGATASGRFAVTDLPVFQESDQNANMPLNLPVCVYGQVKSIREVDRIRFTAPENGQLSCKLVAASLASPLRATLEIRNSADKKVAEVVDTAGADLKLSFAASAGEVYTAAIFDLDFRGDRSFVYQLLITPEDDISYTVGIDEKEGVQTVTVPSVLTGILVQPFGQDRFRLHGQTGEEWTIAASSEKTGSQVDPVVTVLDHNGKFLARGDDTVGSTDARLDFKVPADGEYEIVVSDLSGISHSPSATYEFSIQQTVPDFQLTTDEKIDLSIGGKATLQLNAIRHGGFTDPIEITFVGLPDGVSVSENLQVPAKQSLLKVELQVANEAAAVASLISVNGQALIGEQVIRRTTDPILLCTTIKPPFVIDAEGQDDVTKWPRGTTFPAPVLITREPGFTGEIFLEMTSRQGRHRQGITGPDLRVEPGVQRVLYPVFLPEWLETTRTSRMVVNGVAQVADPQGNLRYSVSKQKTRMGFLPTGARLKLTTDQAEIAFQPEVPLVIPVIAHRDATLSLPLTLTLIPNGIESTPFSAPSQTYAHDVTRCEFAVDVNSAMLTNAEYPLTIRAELVQDGKYPVVSETTVIVSISSSVP